jgi:5-methylcytosine-specific restriction endonuclease McrA
MSKHSSRGTKWAKITKLVYATHGRYCVYCGRDATSIDHVHPKSDLEYWETTGLNPDDLSNLVPSCTSCNSIKGNNTRKRNNWVNKTWLPSI